MELSHFKIIAFTHKTFGLEGLGKLHLAEEREEALLKDALTLPGVKELMFLSTCNRSELLLSYAPAADRKFLVKLLGKIYPAWDKTALDQHADRAVVYAGDEALRHLFRVASSIDSLVVGEREIITQVRNAFERCNRYGTTGDLLRMVIRKTIESAKEVYTQTHIAKKPVSVVSLAYRKLRELNVKLDARFLVIGAGTTNTTMAKYLKKHGFKNFAVFNRTLSKAETLAAELGGKALPLKELGSFKGGFDVMVTCTGSSEPVITKKIYKSLTGSDKSKKIVIDLAVPNDLAADVLNSYDINLIAVNNLQEVAKENLKEREKELDACHAIIDANIEEFRLAIKARQVELAMSGVPRKVKEIRETAINEVFAKDIEQLDEQSKAVLGKIVAYLEKKYISVPMKLAREILIEEIDHK